jgi:hypothetical protein
VRPYDDERIIINFSLWESVAALQAYVYRSAHAEIMRKRRQWFEQMNESYLALWWVPAGHIPNNYPLLFGREATLNVADKTELIFAP